MWGWVPTSRGSLLGVPQNKDYSIWESIVGSPYFGKLPYYMGIIYPYSVLIYYMGII